MQRTGDEYFDSKDFRKMLSAYEEAERAGTSMFMDADDLTDIADYYQLTGNLDKARELVDYALEIHPGASLPLVFKAHLAINDGDIEQAKAYAESIEDKNDPEYTYLTAEIMIASGDPIAADKYLLEYYDTQEGDEKEDVVIDSARMFVEHEVFDIAQKWLSLATDTEHADYKELQARILFANGKYEDSINIFNELIDRDPFSKRDWQALASAQFMNEDFRESVESSEYAIAIDPDDPNSLIAKANGMFRLEQYEEALEYYSRYSEKVPYDDYGLLSQGIALVCLDRLEEAIEMLTKALETGGSASPNRAQIFQEMAFAYNGLQQYDKALECIGKTEELDCDHVEMMVIRGHILLMSGDFRAAEKVFKKAIRESTDAPHTLLRVIVSLHENGYAEAAYEIFKKLQLIYGDDLSNGYSYMALCCNDMRRTDEFLHYLKIACERNPKEARSVLSRYFPKDLDPREYYEYARGLWGGLPKANT